MISYNDEPTRQMTVVISAITDDPDNGILNPSHPLAIALLERGVDDEIEVETSVGTRTVIIQAIKKGNVSKGEEQQNGTGRKFAPEPSPQQPSPPVTGQPVPPSVEGGMVDPEIQSLLGRANKVVRAGGRGRPGQGFFTPQERGTVRKALGDSSKSLSDLNLAKTLLQTKGTLSQRREGMENE